MSPLQVCLWSGPRNLSTALMYSFAQRADTRVVDEPLYAYYLERSDAQHPGREEILAAQDADGAAVVRDVVLGPCDRPVHFQKHMAHHLDGLDWSFLTETVNVLLVREPEDVLTSYSKNVTRPTVSDVGLDLQVRLLEHLRALGQDPAVLDARLVLEDPAGVLERLCTRIGIPFDEGMLRWDAGARSEDGVWASHWYAAVHRSHGFAPYRPKNERVEPELVPVLEACRRHYAPLLEEATRFCTT